MKLGIYRDCELRAPLRVAAKRFEVNCFILSRKGARAWQIKL